MKRNREDNTVSVIQRAVRSMHVRVSTKTIKESLKTHPHYPTLLSICDAINEWKIENYPLRYTNEEIIELSPPYIVHFTDEGGQIAFVNKVKNNKVKYYDSFYKRKSIEIDKFVEKCSGAVILLNPDINSGEKDFKNRRQNELLENMVIPVIVIFTILFLGLSILDSFSGDSGIPDVRCLLLFITKITGIGLSLLLVLHEFDIHTSFTDKLCHINEATNCNTVLNDKAAKIFGWFGWADLGLIYFTGGLILLPQSIRMNDFTYLSLLAAISLPYPVFSVFYQGFVLKKWCPLCLGVQVLLIAEFIILFPQLLTLSISVETTMVSGLSFLITGIIYVVSNMYFREKKGNEINIVKYNGLKKNPQVLKSLLMSQPHYNIPITGQSLVFGPSDAGLFITAFLSLHCSHCSRAFNEIKDILKSKGKVGIIIVLVTPDKEILNTLYYYNSNKKEAEAIDLLDRWYNADPYSRQSFSEDYCIPDVTDVSEEVTNENLKLFKECGLIGTPKFFINGYMLPNQYSLNDIKYFFGVFLQKEIEMQK
jgi:uncharacterized membrane protein